MHGAYFANAPWLILGAQLKLGIILEEKPLNFVHDPCNGSVISLLLVWYSF